MFATTTKKIGLLATILGASLAFTGVAAWAASPTSTPGQHVTLPSGLKAVLLANGLTVYTNNPNLRPTVTFGSSQGAGAGTVSGLTIGE